ncbi:hypothetical protein [Roseibacillus persicicus]|uniref:hypothetical protein n=1 Tax=Roseibacillus persicicus TaxID=454148 RepID=UPI00280C4A21|nr:hypothetical protein [Roseibacillus persicicus]MDQ8190658.1 hypothetical protein [Roseibacillus persicicus]
MLRAFVAFVVESPSALVHLGPVVAKKQSFLIDIWYFSRSILRDRAMRRRFLAQLLIVILTLLVLGNWPLSDWVESTRPRFIVWWGGTTFLTVWMLMLAAYDALRVRREILEEDEFEDFS